MTELSTLNLISLLENWAPRILSQEAEASREDLMEVIRLRARVDMEVPLHLEEDRGGSFFAMLRADRACATPYLSTLLYISREDAEQAARDVGTSLNHMSWYGVHTWEVTEPLTSWCAQVREEGIEIHEAEMLQVMLLLWDEKDRDWSNEAFVEDSGFYREFLEEETLEDVLAQVRLARCDQQARLEREERERSLRMTEA